MTHRRHDEHRGWWIQLCHRELV